MRKLLFIIAVLLSFGVQAQTFTPIHNYQAPDGLDVAKFFGIPWGTTPTLNGVSRPGGHPLYYRTADSSLYLYTGNQWIIVGGGNRTGKDTVKVGYGLEVTWDSTGHQVLYADHPDGLVSGGIVTYSQVGLTFNVSPSIFSYSNRLFIFPQTSLTLDHANSQPRKDVFAIDTLGPFVKKGDSGVVAVTPQLDPGQYALTDGFLVNAGDTVPSNISVTTVYNENLGAPDEFNHATQGAAITADFANIDNPKNGSKDIFISSYHNAAVVRFNATSLYTFTSDATLNGWFYFNGKFTNKVYALLYNSATLAITGWVNIPFLQNDSNHYQSFSIPINSFTWTGNNNGQFNTIEFELIGSDTSGAKGLYMDWITLQKGINNLPPPTDYSNKVDSSGNYKINDSTYLGYWYSKGVKHYSGDTIHIRAGGGGSLSLTGGYGTIVTPSPITSTGTIIVDTSLILTRLYADSKYLQNITGLLTAGTNVTLTGSGTSVSPYVVSASGSGGSQNLQQVTSIGKVTTDTIQVKGVQWTGTPFGRVDSVRLFDHSFGTNYRPDQPDTIYWDRVKSIWGKTSSNYAAPSTSIEYSIGKINQNTQPAGTGASLIGSVGFNDVRSMGYFNSAGYRMIAGGYNSLFAGHFAGVVSAAGSGTGVTRSGTWNTSLNTGLWGGRANNNGALTNTLNDSIIYVNPSADSSILVSVIGFASNGSKFDLYLDNNLRGHFTTNSRASAVTSGTGYDMLHSPFVIMYTGLSLKIHKLKIIKTSSTDSLAIDYFGSLRPAQTSPPAIFLKSAYNDSTGNSITATGSVYGTSAQVRLNEIVDSVSLTWNQNYPFYIINMQNDIDSLWGTSSDHIHPNNLGDSATAADILSSVPLLDSSTYKNYITYGSRRLNANRTNKYRQLAYYDEVLKTSDRNLFLQNTPKFQSVNISLSGSIKYQDGNQSNGKVLTSDGNGNATWQTSAASNPVSIGQAITGGTANSLLYVGAGNKLGQYPSKFSIDTANIRLGIGVSSPTATIDLANASSTPTINMTSSGAIYQIGLPTTSSHFTIQNQFSSNINTILQIMPKGTGASPNESSIQLYNTDYIANQTNTERLNIAALNDKDYIASRQSGTGVLRPLYLEGDGSASYKQLAVATNSFIGINTQSPTSYLYVNGSFATAYIAKTGTYTATSSDHTIDCTSGTFTVTLPTAVGITGRIYVITNSGAGTVTVGTTSSQTFVNVTATPTTLTMATVGSITVQSNGANWLEIGKL